jgi:hypothetical protein
MVGIEFASARWNGQTLEPALTHDEYVARRIAATRAALQQLDIDAPAVRDVQHDRRRQRLAVAVCGLGAAILACLVIFRKVRTRHFAQLCLFRKEYDW